MYVYNKTDDRKKKSSKIIRRHVTVCLLECVHELAFCIGISFFFFIDNYIFQIRVFYDEKEKMKKNTSNFSARFYSKYRYYIFVNIII